MRVGLIGSGNMARALARGWGEPVYCTDAGSGRAQALVEEFGGRAYSSNLDLARDVDIVILAHKPAQLERVAVEIASEAKIVVSLLARTPLARVKACYPGSSVVRVQPNLGVEVGNGVTVVAQEEVTTYTATEMVRKGAASQEETLSDNDAPTSDLQRELDQAYINVVSLFERVGRVVVISDGLLDVAAACSAVGPAYWALVVEAQVDAAIKRGIPADQASILIAETMAGSADLLRSYDYDTLALRRAVASPGGTTARGLAALERGGIRAAFSNAIDEVLKQS